MEAGMTVGSLTDDVAGRDDAGDPRSRPGGRSSVRGSRLLQRQETLSEIRHLLAGTWEHHGFPIVIEGLPGTGKTALLNASVKMGTDLGLRVGRAQCDPAESSTPFGVVRQVFSTMLGQVAFPDEPASNGTAIARRVLHGDWNSIDDPVDVYQSLMLLLEASGPGAAMVAVDDVHWADSMSTGWLQFLARRLSASSIHLVLTTRARRSGVAATDSLVLNPSTRRFATHKLDTDSMAEMMNEHFASGIEPSVVAVAHRMTGGNPLLIARLLGALDEIGNPADMITELQIATLASPLVARSVFSRASNMPEGALDLIESMAVLGSADLRVAAAVAGIDGDDAGPLADALADAGVLSWARPLTFVHPFERQSVYEEIPLARRARAHASAAQILAALGGDMIEIARHVMETDPSGDEWSASVLIEAARREITAGRPALAARFAERADREAPRSLLRAEVARLRAEIDGLLGRSTAVEHLGRAVHLGLDSGSLAETALDLVDQPQDQSSFAAIVALVQSVRGELAVEHPELAQRLRLTESVLVSMPTKLEHDNQTGEPDDMQFASTTTGRLFAAQRALRAAAQLNCSYQELIDALEPLLTPDLLQGGGLVHTAIVGASLRALVKVGAYEIADPLINMAMVGARLRGQQLEVAAYGLVMAESMAMQGRVVAAEQLLADVTFDNSGTLGQCVSVERRWFDALRERKGHDAIPTRFTPTTAVPGLAALGTSAAMYLAETVGRVQLLEGDWVNALANFDRLATAAEQSHVRNPSFAAWRAGRCSALARLGRFKEGAALAEENLEMARRFGSAITIAAALAVTARFQSPKHRIASLEEAVDVIAGTKAELLRCNLLIDLGFARHHAGDAVAARTALRDGADNATRLGATRLAGVAGRGLLACGARPRRLQTSGPQSLTPAELRVVGLAADGNTNASIAATLFINMKTVESHLTRVYKKLGISDRAELRAALDTHNVCDMGEVDDFDESKAS